LPLRAAAYLSCVGWKRNPKGKFNLDSLRQRLTLPGLLWQGATAI